MKVLQNPALGAESEDGQRWRTRPAEGGSLPYPAGAAILSDRLQQCYDAGRQDCCIPQYPSPERFNQYHPSRERRNSPRNLPGSRILFFITSFVLSLGFLKIIVTQLALHSRLEQNHSPLAATV